MRLMEVMSRQRVGGGGGEWRVKANTHVKATAKRCLALVVSRAIM